ncbi:MAG TPA: cell division protein FtsZ [Stellaceae bacterium]|nr:cell division protein FtsZ [Stellaceae bacterium]
MAINLKAPESKELRPRITVLGVGGAGGNAVNNMIEAGLEGVDFVVANTDAQALAQSKATRRIQLGVTTTEGLGAGAQPDVGRAGAEESMTEIMEQLSGAHMVFIAAGMGGGTGTGAAPVIARAVREAGILTVGVVTKPFHFEGRHRMRLAESGIAELQRYVDTLIVIPNQNLFRVANERTTFAEAFAMADQVLHSGVRSITDLMVLPGLINLDFADVRTVMTEMGKAMMGTGEATGEGRALMAAENAIQNPLLDEVTLKGAKAVLVNITGGLDMTLLEVDEAANAISAQVDPDANIIFGAAFDPALSNTLRVSVVATGMDGASISAIEPAPRRSTTARRAEPQTIAPPPVVEPEPVFAMIEPEPIPEPQPQPIRPAIIEPLTAGVIRTGQPGRSFKAPEPVLETEMAFEAPAPEPQVTQPASRPVARIVDPSVADDEDEPLFPETPRFAQERHQKSSWLSIFGRPRHDEAPRPQLRTTTASQAQPEEAAEREEDLEIPSFLRRLAN